MITPQQAIKEFNHVTALKVINNRTVPKLLYAYLDPDTDPMDNGKNLECFYSITVADASNTLRDELKKLSVFSIPQTLNIVKQLLEAVNAAHSKGVFHGAIEPSNILVTREGNDYLIKLTNFGAHAENVDPNDMVEPYYRCPEYIARYAPMSCAADIWAIMTIAVQLLTSQVVFKQGNDLMVLEHMIERCGINLIDGQTFPTDKFMRGLTKDARTQLTKEQLTAELLPKVIANLGGSSVKAHMHSLESLASFIVAASYLRPSERITAASALNRFFGGKFKEEPLMKHPDYNGRDYYNFEGDWQEENEEIEYWAQQLFRDVQRVKYEKFDLEADEDD